MIGLDALPGSGTVLGTVELPASGMTGRAMVDAEGRHYAELWSSDGRLVGGFGPGPAESGLVISVALRSGWDNGATRPWALVAGSVPPGSGGGDIDDLVVTFGRRWGGEDLVHAGRRMHPRQDAGLWIAEAIGGFTAVAVRVTGHVEGRRLVRHQPEWVPGGQAGVRRPRR